MSDKHPDLKIQYNPLYSLKSSTKTEEWIEKEWEKQLLNAKQNHKLLFNGPLFHVINIDKSARKIQIVLGVTNYKTYVCTRTPEFRMRFPDTIPSMPIAACVAIITTDNKLLLEKRKGVDVHEGMYHVVGGFLDPSKDISEEGNPDPLKSIIREVNEETGLILNINQLKLLGLAEDKIVPHFELCYYAKVSYNSTEVTQLIMHSENDGEFNQPVFIDLNDNKIDEFIEDKKNKISPTGRKCIEMMLSEMRK